MGNWPVAHCPQDLLACGSDERHEKDTHHRKTNDEHSSSTAFELHTVSHGVCSQVPSCAASRASSEIGYSSFDLGKFVARRLDALHSVTRYVSLGHFDPSKATKPRVAAQTNVMRVEQTKPEQEARGK